MTTRDETRDQVLLGGATITCGLFAGAIGVWNEHAGIQQSLWTAGPVFRLILAGAVLCLVTVATTGAVILFRYRITAQLTRFLYLSATAAALLALFTSLTFLNVRLDSVPGTPLELELADLFALQVQRRDMKRPFAQHYAAFTVPEGLRNYALVLLREEAVAHHAVGQTVRVVRHRGFFGLPWYQFLDTIDGARNQSLDRTCKQYKVLSARGAFARASAYRETLRRHGVPVLGE